MSGKITIEVTLESLHIQLEQVVSTRDPNDVHLALDYLTDKVHAALTGVQE